MAGEKPLIIDNNIFTSYFPDAGYQVGYVSIDGGQGGRSLNGESIDDELAIKAEVTLPAMPLDSAKLSNLLNAIYSSVYHKVTYYDPRTKTQRTMTAKRDVTQQKYRGLGANGLEYWTGIVVKFTEK